MRVGVLMAVAALALAVSCAHGSGAAPRTSPGDPAAAAPLTPADLQARMKTIQGALDTVHMKLAENRATDAAIDAQTLARAFADVERFWSQHRRDDAVAWARQARTDAAQMASAAASGDTRKATAATDHISSACQQCHAAYRGGTPESGFRIKPGVL